jgi:hypothetical protein
MFPVLLLKFEFSVHISEFEMDSLSGATLVKADGSLVSADSALAGKVSISVAGPDPGYFFCALKIVMNNVKNMYCMYITVRNGHGNFDLTMNRLCSFVQSIDTKVA